MSTKKFNLSYKEEKTNRVFLVYGELKETRGVYGTEISVSKVRCSKDSNKTLSREDTKDCLYLNTAKPSLNRELRIGWAVCSAEDANNYDFEIGIKIAKKRFGEPITTTNYKMLTNDMVKAIMQNELNYYIQNIDKLIKK